MLGNQNDWKALVFIRAECSGGHYFSRFECIGLTEVIKAWDEDTVSHHEVVDTKITHEMGHGTSSGLFFN